MKKYLFSLNSFLILILLTAFSLTGAACSGSACYVKDMSYERNGNRQGKCSTNEEAVQCKQVYIQGKKNWSCQRFNMLGENVKSGWSHSYKEALRRACECKY